MGTLFFILVLVGCYLMWIDIKYILFKSNLVNKNDFLFIYVCIYVRRESYW